MMNEITLSNLQCLPFNERYCDKAGAENCFPSDRSDFITSHPATHLVVAFTANCGFSDRPDCDDVTGSYAIQIMEPSNLSVHNIKNIEVSIPSYWESDTIVKVVNLRMPVGKPRRKTTLSVCIYDKYSDELVLSKDINIFLAGAGYDSLRADCAWIEDGSGKYSSYAYKDTSRTASIVYEVYSGEAGNDDLPAFTASLRCNNGYVYMAEGKVVSSALDKLRKRCRVRFDIPQEMAQYYVGDFDAELSAFGQLIARVTFSLGAERVPGKAKCKLLDSDDNPYYFSERYDVPAAELHDSESDDEQPYGNGEDGHDEQDKGVRGKDSFENLLDSFIEKMENGMKEGGETKPLEPDSHSDESTSSTDKELFTPRERLTMQINRALNGNLAMRDLTKEEGAILEQMGVLDWKDSEAAALVMLMCQFEHHFVEPLVPASNGNAPLLSNMSEPTDDVRMSLMAANFGREFSSLMTRGVADSCVMEGDNKDSEVGYFLSESFVRQFYGGKIQFLKEGPVSRYVDVIRPETIRKKELFFSGTAAEKIERLEKVAQPGAYERVMERQAERGRQKAVLYLFHGEPGTGKTEECRQLALQSGRILLMADAAKLQGKWVGESEKAYRGVFRTLRYVAAVDGKAPILLFNEADSIIGKRNPDAARSVDKMENTLLSILLQELEVMEGIFIATTNLPAGIDPAFINRFIDKIEFPLPDDSVRAMIWRQQLPSLGADALERIARYSISGRSIVNIAQKCDTDDILDGAFPSTEKVIGYCEEEARLQPRFSSGPRTRIGFATRNAEAPQRERTIQLNKTV